MIYCFGRHELDEGLRELRRAGVPVAVQPAVLALLFALVRGRERTLSRAELCETLWPGERVGHSLARAVRGARAAVEDSGQAQTVIRVVRGHGFRFVAPVEEARARSTLDPTDLEEALRRCESTHGDPGARELRRRLLAELTVLAGIRGDRELETRILRSRIVDAIERGARAELERAVRAHAILASTLERPDERRYAKLFRAGLALLSGKFAEVERLSREELGQRARAEPEPLFAIPLFIACREQGRECELLPELERSVPGLPSNATWSALRALVELDSGNVGAVRAVVRPLVHPDGSGVPRDANWPFTLALVAELCAGICDLPSAERVHDALLPLAGQQIGIGAGIGCYGSVERYLGLLAGTLRRTDAAGSHFAGALRSNEAMGARPQAAHVRHEWGRMLAGRGDSCDRDQARALLVEARDEAGRLGMSVLARKTEAELGAFRRDATATVRGR